MTTTTQAGSSHAGANATDTLEQKVAELRASGILVGGHGPRETLRAVAHVPGALDRFLAQRRSS